MLIIVADKNICSLFYAKVTKMFDYFK